jgi:DNA-binding transcriptional LysR family regulator
MAMNSETQTRITLRHFRYFVAVAEAGKMSGAAQGLGVSQSVITDALQSLEAELGTPLVIRHGRGIALTQDGFRFLSHARRVMEAVADAVRMFPSAGMAEGQVKLGVTATVAGYFLGPFLARFKRAHAGLEIQAIELEVDEVERRLVCGEIDFAIVVASTAPSDKTLARKRLFASPRRLWLSPSHRLASARQVRLKDAAGEDYLLLTTDNNEKTTLAYWRRHERRPSVSFRTASIEAVRSLVASGAGVTILSDMVYRPFSLEGDRIVAREIADAIPPLEIMLCWDKRARLSGPCAFFRDTAGDFAPPETRSSPVVRRPAGSAGRT